MSDDVPRFALAALVALAILAGGWTARSWPAVRRTLPLEHVAGATLVALLGWEMLINLPGTAVGYWFLTAGLAEASGVEGTEAFVVAQAAFVIAAALAVLGILRRRTWGSVLGIGLALAVVVWRVLIMITLFQLTGQGLDMGTYVSVLANVIGMGAIPALAGAVLLGLPLLRRSPRPMDASGSGWRPESAAADRPT
jgi:hypothetical protein